MGAPPNKQAGSYGAETSFETLTVPKLRARKGQAPIVMVTAYDATFARLFDDGGADIILVGDSLGMVIQGEANTLGVTVDDIIYHGRAVARGASRCHLVGDMPFMSYQISTEEAVRNAGRIIAEGRMHAVKLEGGREFEACVAAMVRAGIPVMGHLGLTPQSVHAMGGFRVQGRDAAQAHRLVEDAKALEGAGAYSLVLEGIPSSLAQAITQSVTIPTIGIGAGPSCDGQVLVCYDLLGLTQTLRPKFVKRYDEWYARGLDAMKTYIEQVRTGQFPSDEHSFQ